MAKKPKTSPIDQYYDAIRKTFDLQASVLTKVTDHPGEKGRNNEEFLIEFLRRVLPKKFEVGTGFVVSSDDKETLSRQTDIVIYDNTTNSPLFNQLVFGIYPIEAVYGTVEVKTAATARDIRDCISSIGGIRRQAQTKKYIGYKTSFLDNDPNKPVSVAEIIPSGLAPRAYFFAYDVVGWTSMRSFADFVRKALTKQDSAHLHGLYVLKKDWFLWQRPHTGRKVILDSRKGDGLLRFYRQLLYGISSFPMKPAFLDGYLPGID